MAVVVNERDVILQASPSRMEPVETPGTPTLGPHVALLVNSNIFYVSQAGVITPSAITLRTELRGGLAVNTLQNYFSVVVGNATLQFGEDTVNQRILLPSDMMSNFITVRATVRGSDFKTYVDEVSITKVTEGAAGTRGSITVFVSGMNAWSDTVANDSVASATGTAYRVTGDQVTQHNGSGFSETRQWNGAAWIVLAGVYSGSILAAGTVGTTQLANQVASNGYVAGSTGWQLDKSGNQANIYSGIVRGDVRASSAASNAIDTASLQANAVAQVYTASSTTTGNTASVTASVPSGAAALIVNISPGLYVKTSTTFKAWANFTDNGVTVNGESFIVVGPSAGSHVIAATRFNSDNNNNLFTTPMHLSVTVIKK